ncbi:hypothetical protein [Eubacterium oxidoreducens]|uniref:Uncharacterized protein n=1 Tax=Eubacterium oxidoreducens TaxID=1732 RepID=A0A1G6B3J2_EUBOX|nr:hypothetical protein [Eubacterium oxidoreducens]SDB15132.1 hypothetical protein SAMN02910417_01116 [Eubacterium oxidoreducens]
MTREDLRIHCEKQIQHCEQWAEWNREEPHGKVYEEHKLILELLEQEPCEDCWSKKEVVDIINRQRFGIQKISMSIIKEKLEALSLVTPTRNKGKWLGDKAYPICPKCNCNIIEEYISCSDYAEMYKPMKFCPKCGAEMEEDEE